MTETQREVLTFILSTGYATSHPISKRQHQACLQLAEAGILYDTGRRAGGVDGSTVWGLQITRMALSACDKNRTAKEEEHRQAAQAWQQL